MVIVEYQYYKPYTNTFYSAPSYSYSLTDNGSRKLGFLARYHEYFNSIVRLNFYIIPAFVPLVMWWDAGLILGLRPANERRRYFVTTPLIGWAQT